ncbi:glucokinase [Colwellia sp. BRX8-7]|uniref:glucokinase n=1 Tax=Colwellia sp. BRX8-7 TaxID=2759833 RepID=UPI0015F38BB6|nr:glucokinase [Colwellia sp. BRX8-7]MBA6338388.1 glucokinase [Colwellia sp. BRX8-7]
MSESILNLVADIGGTNIRFGLVNDDGQTSDIKTYQCDQYDSLADVISVYLALHNAAGKTINACLAIACPVETDQITMTNLPWTFSQSSLKKALNISQLFLINDYTAIAHAVPLLTQAQKVQIGEGVAIADKPISICGPGTGLGVANLVPTTDGWCCLGGEGGHVDFAPVDADEIKILSYLLETKQHRISYEQLLCGRGLEQIYQAFLSIDNLPKSNLSAEQISAKAIDGSCPICEKALHQFCNTLGSFAGNLALTLGCFGGVYIAGGIVPRFIDFIKNSNFRQRFDTKGRLSSFINNIPTYVITENQPGLIGASAYIRQQLSSMKGHI